MNNQEEIKKSKVSVVDAKELAEYDHWQRINRLISTVLWPLGLCACVTLLYTYGGIDSYAGYSAIVCTAICYAYFFCFLANFRPGKRLRVLMLVLVASFLGVLAYALGFAWHTEDKDIFGFTVVFGVPILVLFLVPPLFALPFSLWNRLARWWFSHKSPERRAKKMIRLKNVLARKMDAFLGRHSLIALSGPKEFVLLSGGWVAVAIFALLVLLPVYFHIGGIEWGDWAIPDEKELRLEKRDVPDEKNAYLALIALTNLYQVAEEKDGWMTHKDDKHFVDYYGDPFNSEDAKKRAMTHRSPASQKRAEKLLADNKAFFEGLKKALPLNEFWDKDQGEYDMTNSIPFETYRSQGQYRFFARFARLVALKTQVALEHGDIESAVSDIGTIHVLGQIILTNCTSYVGYMTGELIDEISYKKMCDAVAMGRVSDKAILGFERMVDRGDANAQLSWEQFMKAEYAVNVKKIE